jgi:hypothetical protein
MNMAVSGSDMPPMILAMFPDPTDCRDDAEHRHDGEQAEVEVLD